MKFIENIFAALAQRSAHAAVPEPAAPSVSTEVQGFSVTSEMKEGVLLTFKTPGSETPHPASGNRYYEISIQSTGENPEYPKDEKATLFRFTASLSPGTTGVIGHTCYIPADARFTGFKVAEEFNDGNVTMGRPMPPHHAVMIRADYKTAEGETLSMALGSGHIRQSERNRPEWKMAASSPIFYI